MKKGTIIIFCIIFILLPFCSIAFSGERPKDFRGLTWGTHISKVPGVVPSAVTTIYFQSSMLLYPVRDLSLTGYRLAVSSCNGTRDERQGGKIYLRPNEKAYVHPSDSLKVGNGYVNTIEYIFTNDKLTRVILRFKDYGQYLNLKSLFFDLYGAPDKEEKRKGTIDQTITYDWYANKDDEANVTLTWWTWDGHRSGSAIMKWKGALKEDAGI